MHSNSKGFIMDIDRIRQLAGIKVPLSEILAIKSFNPTYMKTVSPENFRKNVKDFLKDLDISNKDFYVIIKTCRALFKATETADRKELLKIAVNELNEFAKAKLKSKDTGDHSAWAKESMHLIQKLQIAYVNLKGFDATSYKDVISYFDQLEKKEKIDKRLSDADVEYRKSMRHQATIPDDHL